MLQKENLDHFNFYFQFYLFNRETGSLPLIKTFIVIFL